MSTDTWSKVKELLDACLDLEPAQWSEYLDSLGVDSEIRREVDSLLASHEKAGDFIAHPVLRESFLGLHLGPLEDRGGRLARVA